MWVERKPKPPRKSVKVLWVPRHMLQNATIMGEGFSDGEAASLEEVEEKRDLDRRRQRSGDQNRVKKRSR